MKKNPPRFHLINIGLGLLLCISLGLTAWAVTIYRKTIIPVSIPLFIWVLPGIIITPFFKRFLNTYFSKSSSSGSLSLFWHFFYNIITWGGLTVFGFMYSNYAFASTSTEDVTANILSYGHYSPGEHIKCGNAFAIIDYKGQKRELAFFCDTPIARYRVVHLKIAKGRWGFEVIKDQTLSE